MDIEDLDLQAFPAPRIVRFGTPDAQFDEVESYFDRFGRSPQAFGKIMTRLWIGDLLRKPSFAEMSEPSCSVPS